jgi:hypothetical protein
MWGVELNGAVISNTPPPLEEARELPDRLVGIGNVLYHLGADHRVENLILLVDAPDVADVVELAVEEFLGLHVLAVAKPVVLAEVLGPVLQVGAKRLVDLPPASGVEDEAADRHLLQLLPDPSASDIRRKDVQPAHAALDEPFRE